MPTIGNRILLDADGVCKHMITFTLEKNVYICTKADGTLYYDRCVMPIGVVTSDLIAWYLTDRFGCDHRHPMSYDAVLDMLGNDWRGEGERLDTYISWWRPLIKRFVLALNKAELDKEWIFMVSYS